MDNKEIGKLAEELCSALGIDHAQRLDIHFRQTEVGAIATVEVEFFPVLDNVRQLPVIVKKYNLVAVEKESTTKLF
jgi:hypothetical protein